MFLKFKEISYRHFKNNFILYLIVVICLLIGISAGAITINVLSRSQEQELINFLNTFFKILNEENVNSHLLLKQSIVNNLQTIITIWLLGITVIGIPVIMIVIILRGFIIGFTVGFLFKELGVKGLLFSLLTILPQNLFVIPGIILVSVCSIGFSFAIIKNRIRKNTRYNFLGQLIYYSITIVMLSFILIIGSIVEAYITPVFMELLVDYVS